MVKKAAVTEATIRRTIKALERAGHKVDGIEHRPDGTVFMKIAEREQVAPEDAWDKAVGLD